MTTTQLPGRTPRPPEPVPGGSGAAEPPTAPIRERSAPPTPIAVDSTTLRASTDAHEVPDPHRSATTDGGLAWYLTRTISTMVAICSLALIFTVVVLSQLQHASAQQHLRDRARTELANGVSPMQAVDPTTGRLIAEGSPIGILQIPDIGVDQVVLFGTSSRVLKNGPGLRRDSAFPGQRGSSVIMGRSAAYGGPFGSIDQLPIGAEFTLATGQGVQRFSVVALRRAGDPLPSASPSGSRLTLVTAVGSAFLPSGLLRVDADLVGSAQPTPVAAVPATALRPAEVALAGDPENLGSLVFALQALLAALVCAVVAWRRWGRMQCWVVCGPLVLLSWLWVADNITDLLPNVM